MYSSGDFDLRPLFYIAVIGGVSLIFGAAWLIYFLSQHVTLVLH